MSSHDRHQDCELRSQAAPYVLAALPGREADGYRSHLRGCPACREEVASLQPAVDVLGAGAGRIRAPEELRERLMTAVRSDAELLQAAGPRADRAPNTRRRPPRLAWVGALATAAAVAIVAVVLISSSSSPTQRVIQARVSASAPSGHAQLRQRDGHAELVLSGMPQPPAGKIYEVWLARPRKAPQPTDVLFGVSRSGSGSVGVPGSLRGVEQVLVTAEPRGGSLHPTSAPVVVATL